MARCGGGGGGGAGGGGGGGTGVFLSALPNGFFNHEIWSRGRQ